MSYQKPSQVSIVIPVFRNASDALTLLDRLCAQQLPKGIDLEIVVVDDGSGDDTADRIEHMASSQIQLLRLRRNRGRGAAINSGVEASSGQVILFLDCDCLPAADDLLMHHLESLQSTTVASAGPIVGRGAGFWHRYQTEVSSTRGLRHSAGMAYSASSTNFMVTREAFLGISGFNEAYNNYGFEDRDLQLRLLARGPIAWTPRAMVRHMDALSLQGICRKMQRAGEHSSTRFAIDHPAAYRALGYAAVDPRTCPWLRGPAMLASLAIRPLAWLGDRFLERGLVPYPIRRAYARGVAGLAYLSGASRAPRLQPDTAARPR